MGIEITAIRMLKKNGALEIPHCKGSKPFELCWVFAK